MTDKYLLLGFDVFCERATLKKKLRNSRADGYIQETEIKWK